MVKFDIKWERVELDWGTTHIEAQEMRRRIVRPFNNLVDIYREPMIWYTMKEDWRFIYWARHRDVDEKDLVEVISFVAAKCVYLEPSEPLWFMAEVLSFATHKREREYRLAHLIEQMQRLEVVDLSVLRRILAYGWDMEGLGYSGCLKQVDSIIEQATPPVRGWE